MHRNIALGVVLLAVASLATPRAKADTTFTATLSGSNEVPPVAVSATGSVTVSLTGNLLNVNMVFSDLTAPATAATIQIAGVGVNGPAALLLPSFPTTTSGTYSMAFDLTMDSTYISSFLSGSGGTAALAETALQTDLLAGQAYFEIHDSTFPGGEIRGQLSQAQNVTPEPGTVLLLGTGLLGLVSRARKKIGEGRSMRVTRFFVCFLFLLALLAEQRVFADTIASTTAQAGNVVNTSSSQNPNCPVGPCGVVPPPPGGIPPANQQVLQSQASDGTGASANALVNLVTGSLGVQATGSSQSSALANANFSNEWYCASTCGEIPFRGVPALLHFTLDGTITPPFLLDTGGVSFGGSLGVQFNWQENDIGGGFASFSFNTSYDDTLDVGSPTAQVTFDGATTSLSSPNFTYLTQSNGTVDVAVNWTQPISICPNGCIVLTEGIGTNPVTGGLFGTSSSANIQAEQQPGAAGSSGADFSATFNTTITSLDPSFSFFSDSGDASLSQSPIATPEPDSLVLFGSGLLGIITTSSRRRRLA